MDDIDTRGNFVRDGLEDRSKRGDWCHVPGRDEYVVTYRGRDIRLTGQLLATLYAQPAKPYASIDLTGQNIEAHTNHQEDPTMNKPTINTEGMLLDDAIKVADKHAKALRKQRKAAKRTKREQQAAIAEKARRRALALDALERVTNQEEDHAAAVNAAQTLLSWV